LYSDGPQKYYNRDPTKMAIDLFDFFKLTKKQKPQKVLSKKKEHPDLFRVGSDDISDVKPRTEVLNIVRDNDRKPSIRRMGS